MEIKKLFTMKCFFCEKTETLESSSQRRAFIKFSDNGWRIRADEDVCPKCVRLLPLKVSRRELHEVKKRLLSNLPTTESLVS